MVKIITDSAADFEPWELEKQDIACIPLTVMFGDREYQENVNLSKEQFYDLLAREEGAPKTAQASPAVVGELFQQARQKGEEAVYITLSAALSGTYQGACMAREMAGKTGIYVVDSKNATGGQRLLVEYAVRLRDEGKPASEIAAGVEDLRDRIVLYACIDTLEYLYHGGESATPPIKSEPWPRSSPSSGFPRRERWRCRPRPWECARAWTICASAWSSANLTRSIRCM